MLSNNNHAPPQTGVLADGVRDPLASRRYGRGLLPLMPPKETLWGPCRPCSMVGALTGGCSLQQDSAVRVSQGTPVCRLWEDRWIRCGDCLSLRSCWLNECDYLLLGHASASGSGQWGTCAPKEGTTPGLGAWSHKIHRHRARGASWAPAVCRLCVRHRVRDSVVNKLPSPCGEEGQVHLAYAFT